MLANAGANDLPIATPEVWRKYVLSKEKWLDRRLILSSLIMLSVRAGVRIVERYWRVRVRHNSGSMLVYKDSISAVTKIAPGGTWNPWTRVWNSLEFLTKDGRVGGKGVRSVVMSLAVKYDSEFISETIGRPGGIRGEGQLHGSLWVLGRI